MNDMVTPQELDAVGSSDTPIPPERAAGMPRSVVLPSAMARPAVDGKTVLPGRDNAVLGRSGIERSPELPRPPALPPRSRLPHEIAITNTLLGNGDINIALLEIDGVLAILSDALSAGNVSPRGARALLTTVRDALEKIRRQHA